MHIHLVVPGLVWPNAQAKGYAEGLALPSLGTLLGMAEVSKAPALAFEAWLAGHFGLEGDALAHAAVRRLGEQDLPQLKAIWACADPVHLHFAREQLLLADARELAITPDEAHALVSSLNEAVGEAGRFEMGVPDRWYLQLERTPDVTLFPLADVVSRPVSHFLPEGEEAARWQRITNEAQIVLYNHPVNQAREQAGQRTINSIWFWGAGALNTPTAVAEGRVLARNTFAKGLARSAGIEALEGDVPFALSGGDCLVVLDDLLRPGLYLDLERWREALVELEAAWFQPLLAALQGRHIKSLRISVPGDRACLDLALRPARVWQFWLKPMDLETFVAKNA
jgi:hypothetical protein